MVKQKTGKLIAKSQYMPCFFWKSLFFTTFLSSGGVYWRGMSSCGISSDDSESPAGE
jgi:hypothetical protein